MITSLKISNYALIEHLDISFDTGMTCITGETGAGKSILMGGLGLVLGKRADMSVLKDDKKKCVIEASFLIDKYNLQGFFEASGIDYEAETFLRREIIPNGKSRAFINDTPVNLDVLSRLSEVLIDVHSQLENQSLFKNEYQFLVLDAIAGNQDTLKEYKNKLSEYQNIQKDYDHIKKLKEEAAKIQDYNQFLYDELASEKLTPDMLIPLEEEIDQLSNVEAIQQCLSKCIHLIEEEQVGLLTQFSSLNAVLNEAVFKSKNLSIFHERTNSLSIELKDILDDLISKQETLESNPALLEILSNRWDKIQNLFQKHQVNNIRGLIQVRDHLEKKLQETQDLEQKINAIKARLAELKELLDGLSKQLHQNRKEAFPKLCDQMEQIISKMGMQNARFRIDLTSVDHFLSNGKEQIDFLFSPNLGSDFKPIKKVASGGEMSRIMLSIKAILSEFKQLPSIVFDEIDTGVSGAVSNEIANIMAYMSENMQVFTITHLPQVAAKGKQHFLVYKEVRGNTTITKLKELNQEERINELAQMLSGKELTRTALDHAKQLLN
ncbi:MAG: DNA repair protein RecN [Flavobacteriaceae bacterium]|nr:DNA repair protein RecN [Flavobacteriaceae bacterium]